MSRGLGRVEQEIIEHLERWRNSEINRSVSSLAWGVFSPRDDRGDYLGKPSRSQYLSVCRAVQSLERKGLVRTYKKQLNGHHRFNKGRGGESWCKIVELPKR